MALTKLPEDWKGTKMLGTRGGNQNMRIINESGLYKLVMRSNKSVAITFQHWLCSEVLPTIRRKGEYKMNEEYQTKIKQLEEENLTMKQQKKLLENKVLRNIPRVQFVDRNVIYIITSEYHLSKRTYMIGKAVNLTDRISSYDRTMDHHAVFYMACNNASQMRLVELMVLTILDKYREVKCRDRFVLPEDKDISLFSDIIQNVINLLKDAEETNLDENLTDEEKLELSNERKELYQIDNREDILDQRKNYRDNNKEKIALQQKQFYEKHGADIYSEKHQEYRDNNKEKIAETNKQYYEENKAILNVKTKIWKENNKEKLKASSKEYRKNNREEISKKTRVQVKCECGILLRADSLSRHRRKSTAHKKLMTKKTTTVNNVDDDAVNEIDEEVNDEVDKEVNDEVDEELNDEELNDEEVNDDDVVDELYKYKDDVDVDKIDGFVLEHDDDKDVTIDDIVVHDEDSTRLDDNINKRRPRSSMSKEKVLCKCGLNITKHALPRHQKSKIHENFLNLKHL